ncbi:PH domain-containing protein [Microbacterium sp. EF45047]|uniref:PH domain-containing protein n=1 Tax=Microbacterium sp. EF45047 TaxID=2809708 RepID=UPI0023499309|nr:PH domain-containing protein [Microbacterium sp. EF45047]WCM56288.1 PH domain-containing protein [Microbacterium sp. EF45047]
MIDRPAPGSAAPFRNRGGVALLVIGAVLAALLLADAVVRAGVGTALLLVPWLLLVLWGLHVAGVASGIRPGVDGVLVQNLLRRTFVPWSRVRRIGMRWQVEIELDDGSTLPCFGGPVRSRPQRLGPGRRPEDTTGAAEDAVAMLRRMRADAAGTTPADAAGTTAGGTTDADAPIRRGWDVPALVALAVIVAWAVVAVLLTR